MHPVSDAIRRTVRWTVNGGLFLATMYTSGLPDDQVITYAIAHNVLDSQVSIVANTKARLYMIPGNHDWNNGLIKKRYQTILREQVYVSQLGKIMFGFFIRRGCPGPVEVPINDDVVLIIKIDRMLIPMINPALNLIAL